MASLGNRYVSQIASLYSVLNFGLRRFHELNTDVLVHIFEFLWPNGGLRALSMACWSMREVTLPMLFSHCKVIVKAPVDTARFLPQSLWPYVRSLYLIDRCPDLLAMRGELSFTNDRLLCGVMCATFLKDALRAMPLLRSVSLEIRAREIHGARWDTLSAILSTPQLRSFTIGSFLFSPLEAPPETSIHTLAPITTFRYELPSLRSYLRKFPIQQDSLGFFLPRLHHSLESLQLPSEIAPMTVLAHTRWPQLRELCLNGDFDPSAEHVPPFVSLLSGMPKLRVLNLALALPKGVDRKQLMFWPRSHQLRLPWPDLEALTISFPDPEDQIFAHLPPSLRRLSLRCTPHHCLHCWEPRQHFHRHSPILHASEMLEIFRQPSAPLLDHLQIEYRADDAEDDLMCCITERFPNVRFLEIHRFLAAIDDAVPIVMIAQRLATLHSLHTLRVHLELPPESIVAQPPPGTRLQEYWVVASHYFTGSIERLCETAAVLGSSLPQSGLALWLLRREDGGARWKLFRQVIKKEVDQSPQAELDPAGGPGMPVHVFR